MTGKRDMPDKEKNPINLSEFGRRIKAIRKDYLKLSQQKLAESIDVSPSFISAIEAGITSASYKFFLKMSEIHNINL